MNYINPVEYGKLLKKLSQSTEKQLIKESAPAPSPAPAKEGIHRGMATGPDFTKLTVDERKQLKEYIGSYKTIKAEIAKLVDKASVTEGGDTTGKVLSIEGGDGDDAEVDAMIAKHEKEKEGEEAVMAQHDPA